MAKIICNGKSYLSHTEDDLNTLYEVKQFIERTESSQIKSTTCPNCGAPITGSKCEYCRTDFEQSMLWGNVR